MGGSSTRWIQTYSGVAFDLENPSKHMVRRKDILHALPHINRFLGHTRFSVSVADHSLRVAKIVKKLGGNDEEIRAGLAHDFAEAYVGDSPSPLKALCPELRAVERRVWEAIARRFALPYDLPDVVKRADMIALHDEHATLQGKAPRSWEIPGFDALGIFEVPRWRAPVLVRRDLDRAMRRYGL